MSYLVLDAGNTAVKWAVSDKAGHRFIGSGVEAHAAGAHATLEQRLATAWRIKGLKAVYGTSVADELVMRAIEQAARSAAGLEVQWFESQRHFEGRGLSRKVALVNGYREPRQLGADRWHAMVAACAKFPAQSLIVVSAGTATTVDCIRAEAKGAALFVGGVIAPGFDLMRGALAQGTARLPMAQGAPVPHPNNTNDAIVTGVYYAQVGLVENVVRDFAAELELEQKEPPRLLLTGGRARPLVAPLTRSVLAERAVSAISIEDSLVLRGVALRAHGEMASSAGEAAETSPAVS